MSLSLNKATLADIALKNTIKIPGYDLDNVGIGIVHFGPSNFARSHLAIYAERLLEKGYKNCGIVAVSPKLSGSDTEESPTLTRKRILVAQDNLYSVLSRGSNEESVKIVGSMRDLLIGPNDLQKVIDLMTSESVSLVTMTVTQNGYYYSHQNTLDFDHEDIKESLENSDNPKATVAYIVQALDQRMKKGMSSFGIMSCDNIESNGDRLRATVLAFAGKRSIELQKWISHNTPFYNTMVDRIVPKLDPAVIKYIDHQYGYRDNWPLMTEPEKHMQLIIEHRKGTPEIKIPFNQAGARYVEDVVPYELAKLRLLNGLHMALGVTGRIRGELHADTALKNPTLRQLADDFMKQATETLKPIDGFDYAEYRKALFERLENPYLHDELQRLARNGTEKITSRFLSPLREAYANDTPRDKILESLVSWVKYLAMANEDKHTVGDTARGFDIADSKAYDIGLVQIAKTLNGDISPLLSLPIWEGLQDNQRFVEELQVAYNNLSQHEFNFATNIVSTHPHP
jgi:mannitol 2-dehydrogenase